MEYNPIYEALANHLVTAPFLIICLLELLIGLYAIICWKYNSISGRIGICLIGIILFIIIISIIYEYVSTQQIYKKYTSGECLVTEGVIENYEVGTNEKASFPDRFLINDIPFIISNAPSTGFGYSLRQSDGGVLQDGMKCKIYYIPYKHENVIMKLMVCDK